MPHEDIPSRWFELGSGVAALALVAARRGPLDPATVGAAASAGARPRAPACPLPRGLFPSHRWARFHHAGGVTARAQLLAAAALLALVLARR